MVPRRRLGDTGDHPPPSNTASGWRSGAEPDAVSEGPVPRQGGQSQLPYYAARETQTRLEERLQGDPVIHRGVPGDREWGARATGRAGVPR